MTPRLVRFMSTSASGTKVTTFKKSNKTYNTAVSHNADLDRDGDKIACEKA